MPIDPHAWIATVPFTVFLVSMYYQPSDHALKRLWQQIRQMDQEIWSQLGFYELAQGSRTLTTLREAAFWIAVGALACGSLLSFAVFAGWLGG